MRPVLRPWHCRAAAPSAVHSVPACMAGALLPRCHAIHAATNSCCPHRAVRPCLTTLLLAGPEPVSQAGGSRWWRLCTACCSASACSACRVPTAPTKSRRAECSRWICCTLQPRTAQQAHRAQPSQQALLAAALPPSQVLCPPALMPSPQRRPRRQQRRRRRQAGGRRGPCLRSCCSSRSKSRARCGLGSTRRCVLQWVWAF